VASDGDISSLLVEFGEDAAGHLQGAENSLLNLEKSMQAGTLDRRTLSDLLGSLHTLKGNSGMMGFTPIQQYVHKLETALKKGAEGGILFSPPLFEAFYRAINLLRDSVRKIVADPASPIDFSDEMMMLDVLIDGGGDAISLASPEKTDDFSFVTEKSSTVKVNFARLDELLNLVGELVIHRTTLTVLEKKLKDAGVNRQLLTEFREASQLIGGSASQLREAIMKVRMLPVKVVFQRFKRLVRDLSMDQGKEIKIIFEGEETEIDKTVIDEIGEPLLHLIRNAIDHGIEMPEERVAAGKPRAGTLKLQARHENNHIIICLVDDGSGISAEKIRTAAVEKKVLSLRDAEALSEQEVLQLIFAPGFSTKAEATETSGRGIGLDVVKKVVVSLNGSLDVDSVPGKGTTFTIRLPLTLAIISALMVEVSGRLFAVPLSAVHESVKVDLQDIHSVDSGEIINLRDRLLPVFRLDHYFGLAEREAREQEYLVIIESGDKKGAIIVDRLRGQQEVVIKPMDDYLGDLPGVAGGTVLGDGTVSLILDITSFIGGKSRRGGIDGR
jgi:two-component system chemotaxis sensor kinase CheA